MVGSVYILLNSTMPGYLKIGMTTGTPEDRARELSSTTGVAVPYSVAFAEQVLDCCTAESLIHTRLAAYRVNQRREFFHLPLRDAIRELSSIAESVGRYDPPFELVQSSTFPSNTSQISTATVPDQTMLIGRSGSEQSVSEVVFDAKVRSLGKDYADGTPRWEINLPADIVEGHAFVSPERTPITLRVAGREYSGAVLANKPEHETVWISPKLVGTGGEVTNLGKVLSESGFRANDTIHLVVTGTVVEVRPKN